MDITKIGHSSFKLKGKKITIITDPFDPKYVGIKYQKQKADIVTISHQHRDHNFIELIEENPFIIYAPGEYEIGGTRIIGIKSYHDNSEGKDRGLNTIYHYEIDRLNIVHLGDLGHILNEKSIEALDGIDILFVPIGGHFTLGIKEAVELIKNIEPPVVIPMHHQNAELNKDVFSDLFSKDDFFKEFPNDKIVTGSKFSFTRENLPVETTIYNIE
jgi:L-ascorbate metabolism protein UlaG (beta-lactamase superfamily)